MQEPLVDVLIPVYNAAPTLDAALSSIAAQTVQNVRIVVVDDGSTDQTPALLADWATRDTRIHVVRKENGGIVGALNIGLAHCTAEFIARFDGDDIAYPQRLETQLAFLRARPDHAAVGCDVDHIDERGIPVLGLPRPGSTGTADPNWFPAREPYLIHPFVMLRRAAVVNVGGYRHSPNSEDSDLYWRLQEQGRLHNLDERLGQYRVHATSVSSVSIVSGRVMAVGSQLAAISAARRRKGERDLDFVATDAGSLKTAETLAAMIEVVAGRLDASEHRRLRLAVGIKLLELAYYRPYEIDARDASFIRGALADLEMATSENRGHIRWHVTQTAARLIRKGRLREALILTPRHLLPQAAVRMLIG